MKSTKSKVFVLVATIYVIELLPALLSLKYSYKFCIFPIISVTLITSGILLLNLVSSSYLLSFFQFTAFLFINFFEWLQFVSYYLQGSTFNERFFFHFNTTTIRETSNQIFPLLVLFISVHLILFYCIIKLGRTNVTIGNTKTIKLTTLVLIILTTFLGIHFKPAIYIFFSELKKMEAENQQVKAYFNKNIEKIKEMGIDIQALKNTTIKAKPGKNLILIYLESLEKIYTEENIFPNLTPNLNKFKKKGLFFNNIIQVPGSGWTMAGIVSTQCGTPLVIKDFNINGNDLMFHNFLNKAVCLGDILKKAGYYQVYILGSSADFAGTRIFFKTHGYDKILDYKVLKKKLKDKSYTWEWGLHDDSLFEFAYEEFLKLASSGKPFNLTISTIGTHHPYGDFSKSCKPYPYSKNSMLQAIYCADQLVGKFIEKVSKHPAYKNTIIAILSDHLAMRNVAEKYYPSNYNRRNLLLILNSNFTGIVNKKATPMDIAPTLLSLMNVKHNAHFLIGKNILSDNYTFTYSNAVEPIIKEINYSILSTHKCPIDNEIRIKLKENYFKINKCRFYYSFLGDKLSKGEILKRHLSIKFSINNKKIEAVHLEKTCSLKKEIYFEKTNNNHLTFFIFPSLDNHYTLLIKGKNETIFQKTFQDTISINISDIHRIRNGNLQQPELNKCSHNLPNYDPISHILEIPQIEISGGLIAKNIRAKYLFNNTFKVTTFKIITNNNTNCDLCNPILLNNKICFPKMKIKDKYIYFTCMTIERSERDIFLKFNPEELNFSR